MPPREEPGASAKGAVVAKLKFASWIGNDKSVLEGDKAVLGVDVCYAPPQRAGDDKPARVLALVVAPEETVEVLVMPYFVRRDKAGDLLQHRFDGHIGQCAVEGGGAGLHDTARRELQLPGSSKHIDTTATGVFGEEAAVGGVPVEVRPRAFDIALSAVISMKEAATTP